MSWCWIWHIKKSYDQSISATIIILKSSTLIIRIISSFSYFISLTLVIFMMILPTIEDLDTEKCKRKSRNDRHLVRLNFLLSFHSTWQLDNEKIKNFFSTIAVVHSIYPLSDVINLLHFSSLFLVLYNVIDLSGIWGVLTGSGGRVMDS